MQMKLEDLLKLIGQEADREELLGLSEQYHEALQARETNEAGGHQVYMRNRENSSITSWNVSIGISALLGTLCLHQRRSMK